MYHPLESVGIYVPGGKASYPSTVLMTATLAKVAGVKNIVVVTPPQQEGIPDVVLAACYITGVTSVYQVGGAQSIAALTYGTATIPQVDKIVGPGNQFVAYAKNTYSVMLVSIKLLVQVKLPLSSMTQQI